MMGKYTCHYVDEERLLRYSYEADKDRFRTFDTLEEAILMRTLLYPEVQNAPLAVRTGFYSNISYGLPTVVVLDNPTVTISVSDFKQNRIPEAERYVFLKG